MRQKHLPLTNTLPPRISSSQVPTHIKKKDLRSRLLRTGWERRQKRTRNPKHDTYTKGVRRIVVPFGANTISRYTLADALSVARFTAEEVRELFA